MAMLSTKLNSGYCVVSPSDVAWLHYMVSKAIVLPFTVLVESDGQGWMCVLIGLLLVYQRLFQMLWLRNISNCIW